MQGEVSRQALGALREMLRSTPVCVKQIEYDEMTARVEHLERELAECREDRAALDGAVDALIEERDAYDEDLEQCREELAAAEARKRELRKACRAADEWAAGYPLGGAMDGVAADELACLSVMYCVKSLTTPRSTPRWNSRRLKHSM